VKRDLELIREILLAVENGASGDLEVPGYTRAQVGYHVYLLCDAGYLVGEDCTAFGDEATYWMASDLTWAGHDYLNAVRDDSVWAAVKTRAGKHLPSLTLDVVKALGVEVVKQLIGLPPS
jgi:hypothetical protein